MFMKIHKYAMVSLLRCNDNIIRVGKKFYMRYVVAILYKRNIEKCSTIMLRAIGKNISRAISIAIAAMFLDSSLYLSEARIFSIFLSSGGRELRKSGIELVLRVRDLIP